MATKKTKTGKGQPAPKRTYRKKVRFEVRMWPEYRSVPEYQSDEDIDEVVRRKYTRDNDVLVSCVTEEIRLQRQKELKDVCEATVKLVRPFIRHISPTQRLSFDGEGQTIREALVELSMLRPPHPGACVLWVIPTAQYISLTKEMLGRARYVNFPGGDAEDQLIAMGIAAGGHEVYVTHPGLMDISI